MNRRKGTDFIFTCIFTRKSFFNWGLGIITKSNILWENAKITEGASRGSALWEGDCTGSEWQRRLSRAEVRVCSCGFTSMPSPSLAIGCPPVWERGTPSRESSCPAFSRSEEGREPFLCLLFLNSLQPETALTPRWHVSGGHGTKMRLAKGEGEVSSYKKEKKTNVTHAGDTEWRSEFFGLRKSNPLSEPSPRPGGPEGGEDPQGPGTQEAGVEEGGEETLRV